MRYSTIVDKDENTLKFLQKKAEEYEEGKLLQSLSSKQYSVYEVQMMTADIEEGIAKMKKEHISLLNFAAFFNKEYATDNNKGFETAYRLFNRIRSTIATTKRLYKKTCRRIQKSGKLANGEEITPSVFSSSLLTQSSDLFGLDTYPEAVKELCKAMNEFFKMLMTIIKLCRKVIAREREIREDPKLCVLIYKDSCSKALKEVKGAMSIFPGQQAQMIPLDDFTRRKQNASNNDSLQKFICDGLHTLDIQQLKAHSYCEALSAGNKEGLSTIESKIFNEDLDTGKWIHNVIAHFDELNPKGRFDAKLQKHKVSTKHVAMLMLAFNITRFCDKKEFVENCFFEGYKGIYGKTNYSTINEQYKKLSKDDEEYKSFVESIRKYKPTDYQQFSSGITTPMSIFPNMPTAN